MADKMERYVKSRVECAISATQRQLPTGKLYPLPERTWSHIAVDFVTDLPLSERNKVQGFF